jgi:hypothetical protein
MQKLLEYLLWQLMFSKKKVYWYIVIKLVVFRKIKNNHSKLSMRKIVQLLVFFYFYSF